jgi:Tol biopolymer transport system component
VAVPSAPTQLTYLDRSGREIGKVGEPADQTSLELSPDGTRLLLSIFDPARQTRDLWIQDLKRGVRTRFTFGPNEDLAAVWSPDGQRLVFSSVRSDALDLFSQPADGAGAEELVAESTDNKYPNSWSNDGQLLLFHTGNARSRTGNDVWVLPLGQQQKPRVFLGGTFNETGGRFSPDGRWVSYQSGESGRAEVYVVPYPGPGGKWQISVGGGFAPRWNPNGRELLYQSTGTTIMSVTVDGSGTAFLASTPQKLFETRLRNENYRGYGVGSAYDISPDGQRILANLMTNAPTAPDAVTVVTNWTSLLRR